MDRFSKVNNKHLKKQVLLKYVNIATRQAAKDNVEVLFKGNKT
jgi:hypothetical protein